MAYIVAFFILSLLAITSVVLVTLFFITRKKVYWKILALAWTIVLLLALVVTAIKRRQHPKLLSRQDVTGTYQVDTSFYPGQNALWQFQRYSFTITDADSIILRVKVNDTLIKTYSNAIIFNDGPPFKWRVKNTNRVHLFETAPVLFRSHDRFYYVIESRKYGNMFFRKISEPK